MSLQQQAPYRSTPLAARLKSILPLLPIFIYAFACLHLEELHRSESLVAAPPGVEAFHINVAPGLLSFGVGLYLMLWLLWLLFGRSGLSFHARCWFLAIFLPVFSALTGLGYAYGVAPYAQPQAAILLDDDALNCNGTRIPWSSVTGLEEYSALDNRRGSILGWAIATRAETPAAPATKTWCRITPMIEPSHQIYTAIERRWFQHRSPG